MTTRTMGGMAAALLAAAGLCRGGTSDNQNQVVPAQSGAAATLAPSDGEWETIAASFGGSKADTKPSRDVTMQFGLSVEVREIKAVGGQSVRKGDVLIRARDAEIVAAIDRQSDKAGNETEIKGAEQNLRTAEFKYNMLEKSGTFSPTEFEDAKNAAVVARLQLEQARNNKKQEELGLKQTQAQYQRYWLEAPFDGIIEEMMVEVGEGVTEQTKVLRMVNTEKMWLDPYADTRETIRLGLKEGSPAWVLIDMPDAPKLVRGKVLYVSPVADSVSQTRRVRVEIENPKRWPAGTQAKVRFVEPSGEWEKYKAGAIAEQRSDASLGALTEALAIQTGAIFARPVPVDTSSVDFIHNELTKRVEYDYAGSHSNRRPVIKFDAKSQNRFLSVESVLRTAQSREFLWQSRPKWLYGTTTDASCTQVADSWNGMTLHYKPSNDLAGGAFIFGEPGTTLGDSSK